MIIMKRMSLILIAIMMMLSMTGCGKKCANGCGMKADSKCMAGMCDNCFDYWMGLNGCYRDH